MNIIYYRSSLMEEDELKAAQKYFTCVDLLTNIQPNSLVIPRYSMFPFYIDQEKELLTNNSKPINLYSHHRYIADLQNYVYDLKDLTPKTYNTKFLDFSTLPDKSFVLKGETNSKKNHWKTSMFAKDKEVAKQVYFNLLNDSLIGDQNIYVREYIELNKYLDGINGMPVTEEYRFFVLNNKIVCGDFYWQNYLEDLPVRPNPDDVPREFLESIIKLVNSQCNFYTIDVAKTKDGRWVVIECNDGAQSGLSCIDPDKFYYNIFKILNQTKGE